MKCWATYTWPKPAEVITATNDEELGAIIGYLKDGAKDGVVPVVRIPLTASYWLGVETKAAKANMDKYPDLSGQYRTLIQKLVGNYTSAGVAAILDLHWSDDDTEQQPMALKNASGVATGDAVAFWSSIAQTFAANDMVFYELYNEPHLKSAEVWMNGNAQYAGMLEMLAAVRKYDATGVAIIAGMADYAYDAESLVSIDAKFQQSGEKNVMYNFHPYMGPSQAGDSGKCVGGFEQLAGRVLNATDKPVIITEFGQACCSTSGKAACESCPVGEGGGYDEQIIKYSNANKISWLPWAWRPGAGDPTKCQDANADGKDGLTLRHPTDDQGADYLNLWQTYG